jgi:hypothetical protein
LAMLITRAIARNSFSKTLTLIQNEYQEEEEGFT